MQCNHIILIGNLTRDPELRYAPSGTPILSLGLAANRRYKQVDEQKEEVCFVDVTAFGQLAELMGGSLSKGDMILVEGRLQQRRWETDDGQKRSKHEIVAEKIQYGPRREG